MRGCRSRHCAHLASWTHQTALRLICDRTAHLSHVAVFQLGELLSTTQRRHTRKTREIMILSELCPFSHEKNQQNLKWSNLRMSRDKREQQRIEKKSFSCGERKQEGNKSIFRQKALIYLFHHDVFWKHIGSHREQIKRTHISQVPIHHLQPRITRPNIERLLPLRVRLRRKCEGEERRRHQQQKKKLEHEFKY